MGEFETWTVAFEAARNVLFVGFLAFLLYLCWRVLGLIRLEEKKIKERQ